MPKPRGAGVAGLSCAGQAPWPPHQDSVPHGTCGTACRCPAAVGRGTSSPCQGRHWHAQAQLGTATRCWWARWCQAAGTGQELGPALPWGTCWHVLPPHWVLLTLLLCLSSLTLKYCLSITHTPWYFLFQVEIS